MLAAAMRRYRAFSPRNDRAMAPESVPQRRIRSCCRHIRRRKTPPDVGPPGPTGKGVLKRIEYGSVVCVSPVAASRGAGVVCGGSRRVSHPRFGTIASRHRASFSPAPLQASPEASRQARAPLSPLSPCDAPLALGRRHGANAEARPRQCQCQLAARRSARKRGHDRQASAHPTSSPRRGAISAAIRPAVAACGAPAS